MFELNKYRLRYLFLLYLTTSLLTSAKTAYSQNQTVNSGQTTAAIAFPTQCVYNWTNSNPSIGLSSSGTGSIPSFTAINRGNAPITATITASAQSATSFAYISDGVGKLNVINLKTNTIVSTIGVGQATIGIAINNVTNRVYVANQQSHTISVINGLTNVVVATIPVVDIGEPSGLTLSPDGSRLYVTEYSNYANRLTVINTESNTIITSIPIGQNSWGVVVSPDGRFVYAVSSGSNVISVINAQTNSVVRTISVGIAPVDICMRPDGRYLYVTNYGSDNISVIDTQTNTIVASVNTGGGAYALAINDDGSRLYVTNTKINTVSVLNTTNNSVIATINTGENPTALCFSADGRMLYLITAHPGNDNLSVINTSTNTIAVVNIPVVSPSIFGKFISSPINCALTPITYTITVNPSGSQMVIPNTFSPNGDGINDTWAIKYLDNPDCAIEVFNRWGVKVFTAVGYGKQWDGKFNGVDVPAGQYYYVVNLKNIVKPETGLITLIR